MILLPCARAADLALARLDKEFGLTLGLKESNGVRAEKLPKGGKLEKINKDLRSISTGVTFTLSDVWGSRGFINGLALMPFLNKWKLARGWGQYSTTGSFDGYIEAGIFLWKAWQKFLLPAAEGGVRVIYGFGGWGVNGVRVEGSRRCDLVENDGVTAYVSNGELTALADEVFKVRGDAWFRVFRGIQLKARPDSQMGAAISNSGDVIGGNDLIYQVQCEIADALSPLLEELGTEVFELFLTLAGLGDNGFSYNLVDRRRSADDIFTKAALGIGGCLVV